MLATVLSSSSPSPSPSPQPGAGRPSTSSNNKWPHGAKAAVSFTMDNLGEAQDVRTGTWPAARPHGTHPAVLDTLPRILALLDGQKIKGTYFAEAWSLPVYPQAVALLRARGHEVAWHGYQHEVWHALSEADEQRAFAASFALAEAQGVTYQGFRPPGGDINGARTLALFRQYGIQYVSPLGTFGIIKQQHDPVECERGSGDDNVDENGNFNVENNHHNGTAAGGQQAQGQQRMVVVLPFEWETVDAFWYMDKFAAVRKKHGVQEEPLGPAAFKAYLFAKLDEVKTEGGYISVLFHPFLTTSQDRFDVLHDVLERLRGDPDIWVAPCNEVAKWVSEHADQFGF